MVQQQRQKKRPTLSALEVVFGALHLFLGLAGLVGLYVLFLARGGWLYGPWYDQLGRLLIIVTTLTTGLSGGFLLGRQRTLARLLQVVSAVCAMVLIPLALLSRGRGLSIQDFYWLGGFIVIALWMAWFAWFLKRTEES